MATIPLSLELEYFNDPASYKPLSSGNVYVGQPDTDPEVIGNRITVTLRQESGIEIPINPAAQPFAIGPGGRILYNGSPAQLLVDQAYSLKVTDTLNDQKYYIAKAGQFLEPAAAPQVDEWIVGTVPTYINPTSFSVAGNQTLTYHRGRRVRTTNTSGLTYSIVNSSAFNGTITTVVLENTSGVLDLGLSAVAYGINSSVNTSVPGDLILRELTIATVINTTKEITIVSLLDAPVTAGTGEAYTVTLNETAYVTNRTYKIRIHIDNTGSCTLDIDGIGPLDIKTLYGSDPQAGELKAGSVAEFRYDGTNMVHLNPSLVTTEQIQTNSIPQDKLTLAEAGSVISAREDTERSTTSTSFVKLKEIFVPYGGVFTISYAYRVSGGTGEFQLYVEGSPIGPLLNKVNTTYQVQTDDITLTPHQLVQVYARHLTGGANSALVQNFRIAENQPKVFVPIA